MSHYINLRKCLRTKLFPIRLQKSLFYTFRHLCFNNYGAHQELLFECTPSLGRHFVGQVVSFTESLPRKYTQYDWTVMYHNCFCIGSQTNKLAFVTLNEIGQLFSIAVSYWLTSLTINSTDLYNTIQSSGLQINEFEN